MEFNTLMITDFTEEPFTGMFKSYFSEMGVNVRDWDGLFQEMNGGNFAILGLSPEGRALGFIQFCEMDFSSWFFEFKAGFIREFWVEPGSRGMGLGTELMRGAEDFFRSRGLRRAILTTDSAEDFYLQRGFSPAPDIAAKNGDPVFVKSLPPQTEQVD